MRRQIFRDDYAHGTHSVLSAWHVKGRYMSLQPAEPRWVALLRLVLFVGRKPVQEQHRLLPDRVKHPLVQIVMRLPVSQRVEHVRRLIQFGAI